MARFEESITVNVPVRTAYDQWTQFEDFPKFMGGVEKVRQLDDRRLEWTARIAGQTKQWIAEISDQTPDTRIAWNSVGGDKNAGEVLFEALDPSQTRISLKLEADPDGIVETIGANVGILGGQVKNDLEKFKEFIESRAAPTGAWRGEIQPDSIKDPGRGSGS